MSLASQTYPNLRVNPIACECGKCPKCKHRKAVRKHRAKLRREGLGPEARMSERMPWPAYEFEPHFGSSLSTPDVPYRIARGRGGCE